LPFALVHLQILIAFGAICATPYLRPYVDEGHALQAFPHVEIPYCKIGMREILAYASLYMRIIIDP
jgi:hypothetical protein